MNFIPMQVGQSIDRPYHTSTPPPERPSSCTDFEKIRLLTKERIESPTLRYKGVIQKHRKVCELRAQAIKQKKEPYQKKEEKVLSCCERIWAIVEANIEYSGRFPMSYPPDACLTIHAIKFQG